MCSRVLGLPMKISQWLLTISGRILPYRIYVLWQSDDRCTAGRDHDAT